MFYCKTFPLLGSRTAALRCVHDRASTQPGGSCHLRYAGAQSTRHNTCACSLTAALLLQVYNQEWYGHGGAAAGMYAPHMMPPQHMQPGMDPQYSGMHAIPASPAIPNAGGGNPFAWPKAMPGADGSAYDGSAYAYDPHAHAAPYAVPAAPVPVHDGTTYFAQQW